MAMFLLCLLTGGCVGKRFPNKVDAQKVDMVFNQDIFSRGGKAVVIIEEENDIPANIKLHGQMTFSDYEGEKYILDIFKTSVFMINPGMYKLENFKLCGNSGYWSTQVDYEKRYKAHFNVAAGDVVYLGKLSTQILLDQTPKKQNSSNRKEIVTVTKVKDEMNTLPQGFLSAVTKFTGSSPVSRIMSWHDDFEKGGTK